MSKVKANGPVFYVDGATTVCLLMVDNKVVARGISVASALDAFIPLLGRKNALDVAREAAGRKKNCKKIDLFATRYTPFDWFNLSLAKDRFGDYKGVYEPELTDTEKLFILCKGIKVIKGTLAAISKTDKAESVEIS